MVSYIEAKNMNENKSSGQLKLINEHDSLDHDSLIANDWHLKVKMENGLNSYMKCTPGFDQTIIINRKGRPVSYSSTSYNSKTGGKGFIITREDIFLNEDGARIYDFNNEIGPFK